MGFWTSAGMFDVSHVTACTDATSHTAPAAGAVTMGLNTISSLGWRDASKVDAGAADAPRAAAARTAKTVVSFETANIVSGVCRVCVEGKGMCVLRA